MAEGEVQQYFVRNDKGTIWGPLALSTIELLIEQGKLQGRLQISEDGIRFAFPGRFPHLRHVFPREMWGDLAPGQSPPPAAPPPASAAPAPVTPAPPGAPAAPIAPGAPVAGPGIPKPGPGIPMAGPGIPKPGPGVPMAGPGIPKPGPGATRPPGVPVAGPGAVAKPPAPGAPPGPRPAAPPPGAVPPGAPAAARPQPPPGAPATAAPRPATPPAATPAPTPATPPPAAAAAPPPTARPSSTGTPVPPAAVPRPSAINLSAIPPIEPEPPPASGQLETTSPVRLYGLIAAGNLTGLLSLTLADASVSIHFRKGNPELVDSTSPEDALGTWLAQSKLVTPEQLQQAEAARGRFGGELLAALFGLGLLQPASAFAQLAQRAQAILLKGLRAESGSFTFEPKELPAAKAMPLGNKWAVLGDLVRRIPTADLKRRLQPVLPLPVMKSQGHVATGDLRLTPHEVRVLALIDGVRSTGQLLNDLPQDAEHLLRLVFLLRELDAVSFAAVRSTPSSTGTPSVQPSAPPPAAAAAAKPAPAATPPPAAAKPATAPPPAAKPAPATAPPPAAAKPAAAPPPAAAKPAAAPPPTAKPAAAPAPPPAAKPPAAPPPAAAKPATGAPAQGADELPALRELAQSLKEQNFFERLGLGPDTNGPAVKIAYFKLAKQYHPDTLPPGAPPELEKLKADIFAYIGEAYRAISDDKARAAYIEELKSGSSTQAAEVDVEAILKSEELFRKAGHYIKARKFAEAAALLDEAIQLNGQEPEFYAWRGYARFFTFEDKKVGFNEAYRDIQACLKKNDKVASAHYFLGVIAKLCGDTTGALKHFQKTVELQPNHIDAQREIRMASQKK